MTEIETNNPEIDSHAERAFLTLMIISDEFLSSIIPIYEPFLSDYSKLVGGWCLEYYNNYKCSPKKQIEEIFAFKSKNLTPDFASQIEKFLLDVSGEYRSAKYNNLQYYIDEAEKHFRKIAVKRGIENAKESLISDRIEDAEKIFTCFKRKTKFVSVGFDPFENPEETEKLLVQIQEEGSIFEFPGVLGDVVGRIKRGDLIAFQGFQSVGKTWWLLHILYKSFFEGKNVLFASMEMTLGEIVERLSQMILAATTDDNRRIFIPVFDCEKNQSDSCRRQERNTRIPLNGENYFQNLHYKPCTNCTIDYLPAMWKKLKTCTRIKPGNVRKKIEKINEMMKKGQKMKILPFPSKKIKFSDFVTHIDNLAYFDGFIPDIIITDYADKFVSDVQHKNRHDLEIRSIWEGHKALAQEKYCAVFTASQSNEARRGGSITGGTWTEGIAKQDEIDCGIGISQGEEEKEKGIMKLHLVKKRSSKYFKDINVNVLYSYDIGRPYLDSRLERSHS